MMEELYKIYRECGYRVSTDTRTLQGGELFFALRGENFDGNQYAAKALEAGAAYAVVDSDVCADDPRAIRVEDSYIALRDLATWHREHVLGDRHLTVIGLTGTNGKTTTKELIRSVLAKKYEVCATEGNLNNDIGVPLTLLRLRPSTQIAVVEMGASHPDDIQKLVRVCRPDCGLITNVGKAHLLGFGSFDGVKAAKGALYDWIAGESGGFVFLNADDGDLCGMAASRGIADVRRYGLGFQGAEVLPSGPDEPFVRIALGGKIIESHLVGAYNATNILAALAVGKAFGVPDEDAVAAVESYEPSNNRSQMLRTERNTVIVDAYNANPSSMAAAIANFANVRAGRKIVLLGDMLELGETSVKEHQKVIDSLSDDLEACLVGDEFRKALDLSGSPVPVHWFPDSSALASYLEEEKVSGAVILVKGSRGIRMEKVLEKL